MKRSLQKSVIIFAFIMHGLCNVVIAQIPLFDWVKPFGGTQIKSGNGIALDQLKNVYTIGDFRGTVDFNPDSSIVFNLSSAGDYDVFISKLDSNGTFVWAKRIGGIGEDRGTSLALDSVGNVYYTGSFRNTVDFNPNAGVNNLTETGYGNTFVSKLDSQGNFVWAKNISNSNNDGFSITLDIFGNVLICGSFNNTADFDPNAGVFNLTAQSFATDAYILKLSNSGNFIWVKAFSGLDSDWANFVKTDNLGNCFVSGYFYGTVDCDPGINTYNLTSNGGVDGFITKLDVDGNLQWATSFGSTQGDIARSLALDSLNNLYVAGFFSDTVDFDPGPAIFELIGSVSRNSFLMKLTSGGNFVWAKGIGGLGEVLMESIALDKNANIYVTGHLIYTSDFDPDSAIFNLYSDGGPDIVIAKYTNTGSLAWALNFGGNEPFGGGIVGNSIALDEFNNIYITGIFGAPKDFDPSAAAYNLTSVPGVLDVFVYKLKDCTPVYTNQSFTFCPGIGITVANNIYYNAGIYNDTLMTQQGCDSIVVTNLSLHPTYNDLESINLCEGDSAFINGNYTSIEGAYYQTIIDTNSCTNTITTYLQVWQPINTTVTINNSYIIANYFISTATYQWLDCDNNFNAIPGETNQIFTPTINGNYAVIVSNQICTDTSACSSFLTVGLNSISVQHSFYVYPNPASNEVFIQADDLLGKVEILDLAGRIILSEISNTNQITINTSEISSGFYWIKCENKVFPFIIQH